MSRKRKWRVDTFFSLLLLFLIESTTTVASQRYLRSKVVGGSMIDDETNYSYFVSLGLVSNGSHKSFCGGTLIDQVVVLTAAHCLDNIPRLEIGFSDSSYINAESWKLHPDYNSTSLQHDIALVFLEKPASIAVATTASLVAESNSNTSDDPAIITAIGIGHTNIGSSSSASSWNQFKKADLKIISNLQQDCGDQYSTSTIMLQPDQQFCATGAEEAACHGDSGGPAIQQNSIVGIISFGACQINVPTVFTKVSYYLEWIYRSVCIHHASKTPQQEPAGDWWCKQQQQQEQQGITETATTTNMVTKRKSSLFGTAGGGFAAFAGEFPNSILALPRHSDALSGFHVGEEQQQEGQPVFSSQEELASDDGSIAVRERENNKYPKEEAESIFYTPYKTP